NLPTFGLTRNTPHLIDPGIGSYGSSIVVINSELLARMPEQYQTALAEASENAIANGLEEMDVLGERACAELRESGTELSSMPAGAVGAWKEQAGAVGAWKEQAGIAQQWVDRYTERGYDAEGVLADYRRIVDEESARSSYADPFIACLKGQTR
ncbi:MAG: extracellular solute-binding protein, partial [Mycobacterium sp.]|nr:extracellular solute-binding protein [Mycobacterium sp.]